MDGQTGREKIQAYIDRSGSDGGENQGVLSDKSRTNVDIERFTTPQGEVYGFVTKEGKVYLVGKKLSPELPIPRGVTVLSKKTAEGKKFRAYHAFFE